MSISNISKTPANNSCVVQWNSTPAANNDAYLYVSANQVDLSNPPNFPGTVTAVQADQSANGLLPSNVLNANATGLNAGTTYYLLCSADGTFSSVDSFTTTGGVVVPPVAITAQDNSMVIDSLAPLTVRFEWDGPNSAQGQVFLGTTPTGLALSGTDATAGARHSYPVSQGLQFNQTYYYQVVSLDANGAVLSQGPVIAFTTPKAPSNTITLQNPPAPLHFVSSASIKAGGRAVITVSTRDGAAAASGNLVEFSLRDATMGKLGHGNTMGGAKVQIYADPNAYEGAVFISTGKKGTAYVDVKAVGSANPQAVKTATIQVV